MIAITKIYELWFELINYPLYSPHLIPNEGKFFLGSKLGSKDTDFHQMKTLTSTGTNDSNNNLASKMIIIFTGILQNMYDCNTRIVLMSNANLYVEAQNFSKRILV